jgi:hypothetical protein
MVVGLLLGFPPRYRCTIIPEGPDGYWFVMSGPSLWEFLASFAGGAAVGYLLVLILGRRPRP